MSQAAGAEEASPGTTSREASLSWSPHVYGDDCTIWKDNGWFKWELPDNAPPDLRIYFYPNRATGHTSRPASDRHVELPRATTWFVFFSDGKYTTEQTIVTLGKEAFPGPCQTSVSHNGPSGSSWPSS
ncbi:hypothetical protein [Saccharopolyspora shandongensis]|uniref:hypothetical protein n=1 Tax=Saccharopolyspora shandongensis TaxID=418495 RepID=UPI0033F21E5D